ncbi:MAG: hypothetical protein AB7K63_12025 [Vicinamibacterales bacterium]
MIRPLLRRIGRYGVALKRGIERLSLMDGGVASPHIDTQVVQAATRLAAVTPRPQRVRVAGRLDLMGASQSVLKIEVQPGEFVTVLWQAEEPIEDYRDLFNTDVVVEGLAVFRPSGTVLRIDADVVAAASQQEGLFRRVPHAAIARDYQRAARLKPNEPSAYRSLRGSMPTEAGESDDDFLRALAELR